jgi:Glycosyltransferase WbsX
MESARRDMEGEPATVVDNDLTICAWNEWAEGGHIEPNVRDHAYYLEKLQQVFGLIPREASVPPPAASAPSPPGPTPPPSKSKPQLSNPSLKPDRFKVAPRKKAKSKGGTSVAWHDSAAASTRLVVLAKKMKGHLKARWVAVGNLGQKDKAGANSVHFSGRLGPKALHPGRYPPEGGRGPRRPAQRTARQALHRRPLPQLAA